MKVRKILCGIWLVLAPEVTIGLSVLGGIFLARNLPPYWIVVPVMFSCGVFIAGMLFTEFYVRNVFDGKKPWEGF